MAFTPGVWRNQLTDRDQEFTCGFFFFNFIQSLVQTLKNRGKLTEPEVRYLMFQAVQACSYLHAQRVIHRDIKVGNFFLNADMELRLGDFGLAVRLKEEEKKIK